MAGDYFVHSICAAVDHLARFDFGRQERIGNRRACRADQIRSVMPRLNWLTIVSGEVNRSTVTTGFVGDGIDEAQIRLKREDPISTS